MNISANPTNPLEALATDGKKPKTALDEATVSQDRFLTLLVAQLNNQDPMNPMDNAQMTSQMAQINTVTGIQQLNETVKVLSAQFASQQVLQGASMLGHDVLTQGSTLSINNGVAKGAFDLLATADRVSVQIISPGGQLVDTINMGVTPAGRRNFEWDASAYTGGGKPSFKVVATQGGQPMTSTSLVRDTVSAVGNDGAGLSIQLKGGATVAYDDIKAIL